MTKESRLGLKAVVFDWAGTVVDFGSLAPMGAFVKLFARHGIDITIEEARIPMGLPKWDHIKALGSSTRIADEWKRIRGRSFTDADVDALYEMFTPMNAQSVTQHSKLIPGVIQTVEALRQRHMAIGTTTGYNRAIMDVVVPLAAAQGFSPDNLVCAGDLAAGRPSPLMMYRTFADLGVWPPSAVVKVDDTIPGIDEGNQAGCWTVGVSVSGNFVGLSEAEWVNLDPDLRSSMRLSANEKLLKAGAHFVVDSVADLIPVIDEIETLLAQGVLP